MTSQKEDPKRTQEIEDKKAAAAAAQPLPASKRSIVDIVADLSKPIPARLLKSKTVGGQSIKYLPWHKATKFLDLYAAGWSYSVQTILSIAGKLIIVTRITIPCLEGEVYREATGQEDEDVEKWGDSSSNAESMSLRRAAAKFGLGLDLYDHGAQERDRH